MKPLMLKIKGINSFLEEQTVDFETLTKSGLFGIFGPTGSGKSSILDAMTIALYGKLSRNSGEFINKAADTAYVSFTFRMGYGGTAEIYTVERSFRRETNKTTMARIFNKVTGEVIEEQARSVNDRVEKIIGLSYDDFTRSVVLPQGKFSEFLTLKGLERRKMLERIFRLEKYGSKLSEKIRKKKNETELYLKGIQGALSTYDGISEEKIKSDENELEFINTKITEDKKEIDKLSKRKTWADEIFKLSKELIAFESKMKELSDKQQDVSETEVLIDKGKKAHGIKSQVTMYKENNALLANTKADLDNINTQLETATETEKAANEKRSNALETKNNELPTVIKKQEAVQRAVDLQCEIDTEEKTRADLLSEYKILKKECTEKEKALEEKEETREEISRELKEIREKKDGIKLDSEYKANVYSGFGFEKELADVWSKLLKNRGEAHDKAIKITELTKNLDALQEKRLENESVIAKTQSLVLENNGLFVSGEAISHASTSYNLADSRLKILADAEKKRSILIGKMDISAAKIKEISENIEKLKAESEKLSADKGDLENALKTMESKNMAYILAAQLKEDMPCPVCGSKSHPSPEKGAMEYVFDGLARGIEDIKEKADYVSENIMEKKTELATEQEARRLITDDIKHTDEIIGSDDSSKAEKDVQQLKEELENLTKQSKCYEKTKEDLESKMKDLETQKNQTNLDIAKNESEKSAAQERADTLWAEIADEERKYKDIKQKHDVLMESLCLKTTFAEEKARIEKLSKEYERLESDEKKTADNIDKLKKTSDDLQDKINKLKISVQDVTTSGKEIKRVIDEKREQIHKIISDKNPKEYLKELKDAEKKLISDAEDGEKCFLVAQGKTAALKNESIRLSSLLDKICELDLKYKSDLEKVLTDNDFKTLEEAEKYFISEPKLKEMEKNVLEYKDSVTRTEENIKRLNEKLAGNTIMECEVLEICQQLKRLEDLQNKSLESRTILTETIRKSKESLMEVNRLLAEEKSESHKFDLLLDLAKLTEGNRFVEYMAESRLQHIAMEASVRLSDISLGRYALELLDGDFIIRDDFNGGSKRRPNTLSGGELFLVSFSLALALSNNIQMKNNTALQFFFLDEGFGTLDASLIETVLSSLEKVRDSSMSVGIITHVEEIKERISTKLLVIPANQGVGGTHVQIAMS